MRAQKPLKKRQKRCLACNRLFSPDPRTKDKQRHCSRDECQRKRQRRNEKDWRRRNPDCLEYQHTQTREWHKARPYYSGRRRAKSPGLLKYNRDRTRMRMQKIRLKRMFDKSKLILTQLVARKGYKCYLARGYKWLHIRLTKASPLSRLPFMRDNGANLKRVSNRLPQGKLYDISEEVFNQPAQGP